jgi:hypothetical protein
VVVRENSQSQIKPILDIKKNAGRGIFFASGLQAYEKSKPQNCALERAS